MVTAAAQPDALLGWMECLSDPTRLRLLRLLERHELGVAELCDVLQVPQSTGSRHLQVLADESWVRSRPRKVLADESWVRTRPHRTTNLYRMDLEGAEAAARRLWALAREQTDGW